MGNYLIIISQNVMRLSVVCFPCKVQQRNGINTFLVLNFIEHGKIPFLKNIKLPDSTKHKKHKK